MSESHVLRWCAYDFCCEFTPETHNHIYCPKHRCKRRAENSRKRLSAPIDDGIDLWATQERRKQGRLKLAQAKNEWLLERSRIGFFDLETSNLSASIGMILCGCVLVRGDESAHTAVARRDEDGLLDDRKTVVQIRDWLESLDYVVSFYGTRFDVPFLNTRLLLNDERPVNQLRHVDLYYTARNHLKLHSNRLAVVEESLFGRADKTRVVGPIWTQALMGDQEAMGYIVEHCEVDVRVLGEAFERLRGFVNLSPTRWRKFGGSY